MSGCGREAMWEYVQRLELMERIAIESRLSEKDVLELGKKVKTEMSEKYR